MRGKGEGGIYKTAEGFWIASIQLPSHDGRRRRKTKKSKDKAVVIKWLAEQKGELGKRGDLPTASPTLESWSEYWLDNVVGRRVRPNTLTGYRHVMKHLCRHVGKVHLDKLTPTHVRRAEDGMRAAGLSETTALLAHRVLGKCLADAEREGKVGRVATRLMDAPRKAATDIQALTVQEAITVIGRVVPALKAETYDPLPALWATYLLTGARRGEILGLEWDRIGDEIDLSWQMQYIKAGASIPADYEARPITGQMFWTRPKTNRGWRLVPLVDPLKTLLAEHRRRAAPNPWGLVFTSNDRLSREYRPIDPPRATAMWKEASPNPAVTVHGLRHTTVDLLLEAGVPEDVVMEIVGHSQLAVTRSYKTPTKLARRKVAMEQLSTLLLPSGT